uniref:phosphoglycerate mutase n=1 Tax=Pulvinaster venetus TaxID=427767 RepID=UPI001FCD2A13|nr:phosphoglycerate mutase [Pulvinaster venetus]UNJ16947.1 phosphoglycerate mutase [Pulvinaster venetus]
MSRTKIYPTVLTILDGWGYTNNLHGNAFTNASTPILDSLINNYPMTFLHASGEYVGLPKNQMGNSEVGHVSIGGGRIIPQDLVKISNAIEDKSFFLNNQLISIFEKLEINQNSLHLIGLCSDGGVHSHIAHLFALINFATRYRLQNIYIHIITDGRDTNPFSAINFVNTISKYINDALNINIVTIMGRYYAMDRDSRWARTEQAYNILINDDNFIPTTPAEYISKNYDNSISDEFILPIRVNKGAIKSGDAIIFFNYRPDRMRQLVQAFAKDNFKGFTRNLIQNLNIATFTQYDSSLPVSVIFKPNLLNNFLGEIVSQHSLKQLRISETEKYAHVTYFFNGGVEEPFSGEDRELIASPKVATYDLAPEMSSDELTRSVIKALEKNYYSLIIINYPNPDMLGHTGNYKAALNAMEIVDECIGKLVDAVGKANGLLIITADHGNIECMLDEKNQPHTSHTTNLVPFLFIEGEQNRVNAHGGKVKLRSNGSLVDIAPTILDIMNLGKPQEMTGISLIEESNYELR